MAMVVSGKNQKKEALSKAPYPNSIFTYSSSVNVIDKSSVTTR
jgi:hypothetical protein